jgi:hypothetical protein
VQKFLDREISLRIIAPFIWFCAILAKENIKKIKIFYISGIITLKTLLYGLCFETENKTNII